MLDEPEHRDEKGEANPLGESFGMATLVSGLALAALGIGLFWGPLATSAHHAVSG